METQGKGSVLPLAVGPAHDRRLGVAEIGGHAVLCGGAQQRWSQQQRPAGENCAIGTVAKAAKRSDTYSCCNPGGVRVVSVDWC